MGKVIDCLIFVVMAGLAVSMGYSAFYEQFLILTPERQVFVTLSYTVIYGGIYIATRLVTKDERFEEMILKPKTTLQRAVQDGDHIFSIKTFCIMVLLSGIWLDGSLRYIDEFDWEGAPWLLFRSLLDSLIDLIDMSIFWVFLSVFVYVIFKFFQDIQFSIIFRLCGYVFIHFIVLFVLVNATLIWPQEGSIFLATLTLFVPFDLWLLFFSIQFIWSSVLILWSLFQPFKRME